ncbi:ZIP-like iron-zinc transporter [Auriculariales sp. MPI-PUGE-AT-0066]|nr:ZIP-like iron-zinc transporter [Auriculariales sp. MPI-PUGE-AT-0066]
MPSRAHILSAVVLFALVAVVAATALDENKSAPAIITDEDIAACSPVVALSAIKAQDEAAEGSNLLRTIFGILFPFGPGPNSILATFYISSVPNLILAFIPAQISPETLNTMTAFATGGLLSDVFLHLVPHSFTGEATENAGARFILVEEKRNVLIGLAIFGGFASFFMMEKTLRVLGAEGHSHDHGDAHAHGHEHPHGDSTAVAKPETNGLRQRTAGNGTSGEKQVEHQHKHEHTSGPSKLSAYLNLFGDFVHNITDGLAMAASFYSSPLIGATTTLACFAHEIPHEIADYSILVRAGFSKRQAMMSQFGTAIGAFVGTFMGIAIHNITSTEDASDGKPNLIDALRGTAKGFLGTTVAANDLVIPFVAAASSTSELLRLLEDSKSGKQALREFAAMAFGVLCMFLVAWNE